MSSPTQRSLTYLRKSYPLVQVVERWNPFARRRVDLFGIIDVVAVGDDIMAVQTTSSGNVSARVKKILESDALPILLRNKIRVVVHGWRKNAKGKWVLREVEM